MQGHQSPKLAPRYFGPYQVTKVVGTVPYELALPPRGKNSPCFSHFKAQVISWIPPSEPPPLSSHVTGTTIALQPLKVLGTRLLQTAQGPQKQMLVQ